MNEVNAHHIEALKDEWSHRTFELIARQNGKKHGEVSTSSSPELVR